MHICRRGNPTFPVRVAARPRWPRDTSQERDTFNPATINADRLSFRQRVVALDDRVDAVPPVPFIACWLGYVTPTDYIAKPFELF